MNILNTKSLFQNLKIEKNILSTKQKKDLNNNGFIILKSTSYMKKKEVGKVKNNTIKKGNLLKKAQIV